jgi:hypothetical protein
MRVKEERMIRMWMPAITLFLVLSGRSSGQGPGLQFRWQPGLTLSYRVEHVTSASETLGGQTSESKTKLKLQKQWKVLEVDSAGVATLQLALAALRLETVAGTGKLLFDSADPAKSDPDLRSQLQKYVGPPIALLRIDARGRVVEVKESQHGPASRWESELPFIVMLPDAGPQPGQTWERSYKITLEPPQGTGEKYDAVQKYDCKAVEAGTATMGLTTILKSMPENLLDRVPLLQLQPEGEVVFDLENGRLAKAVLHIKKEMTGQQGQGSSYRFESTYTEEIQ